MVSIAMGSSSQQQLAARPTTVGMARYFLLDFGHRRGRVVHECHQTQQPLVHGTFVGGHGPDAVRCAVDGNHARNVQLGATLHWHQFGCALQARFCSHRAQMAVVSGFGHLGHDAGFSHVRVGIGMVYRLASCHLDLGHVTWRHCRNGHHRQSVGVGCASGDSISGMPIDCCAVDCGAAVPVGGRARTG